MAEDLLSFRAALSRLKLPLSFGAGDPVEIPESGLLHARLDGFLVGVVTHRFVALLNALPSVLDRVDRAEERVANLEAIVKGRTTPPTDAEICAHDARDGAWLVTLPPRAQGRLLPETRYVTDPAEVWRLWWSDGAWWVPVLHGRPCAWPTAEVSRG